MPSMARSTERHSMRVVLVLGVAATMVTALPAAGEQGSTASTKKEFREFTWARKAGVSEPACRLECQSACVSHLHEYCPIQRVWMSRCKTFSEHQERCEMVEIRVTECTKFEREYQLCASVLKRRFECGPLEGTRQRCADHEEESAAWNACVGSSAAPIRRCRLYFERVVECEPHLAEVTRCETVTREMERCTALPPELTDSSMQTIAARTAYLERVCRAVREAEPACGNPTGQCSTGCQVRCR